MAGEIFIAQQNTLEEVKSTVNGINTNVDIVNTTTSETKTQTTSIKSDIDGLKLSTDSINQIADTILEKIGLTTDVGGINTGTVFGKLNALFSSGGGISGFKHTHKTGSFIYRPQSSGVVIGQVLGGYTSTKPTFTITNGGFIQLIIPGYEEYKAGYNFIGFFSNGTSIKGTLDNSSKDSIVADVFEFI